MTLLGAFLVVAAVIPCWLVVTQRWHFPLLFDCGLSLLGLGLLVNGIEFISGYTVNERALFVAGSGAVLMTWSYLRKMRYLNRIQRSKLRHIDGSIMR